MDAGRQLDNSPCLLARRTHSKEQQVNAVFIFLFFSLSSQLSLVLSWMGYGNGPDWQELWKIWQVPLSPSHFGSPLTLCCCRLRKVTFKMKSRSVRKNVKAFMLSHGININSLSPPPVPLPFCLLSTSVSFLSSLSLSPNGSALFLSLSSLSLSAPCLLLDCLSVCLRLCAGVLTRETEREGSSECVLTHACVCVCVHCGACWQTEAGGGTVRRREGGEKRER